MPERINAPQHISDHISDSIIVMVKPHIQHPFSADALHTIGCSV